jgi:S-formylglutathione hydrolase FrmB
MTRPARISRRRLLLAAGTGLGAAGAAALTAGLVRQGAIDGPDRLARLAGACGGSSPAGAEPGPLVDGTFDSAARGRRVAFSIAYPPGARPGDRLPVCLVLHGRGADHRAAFGALGLHRLLAAQVRADPGRPFALAAPDGGGDLYWHRRASGDDPLGMLLSEFAPLLAGRGLDAGRPAALGWSMGGYGALLLGLSAPGRVAAVGALSPALTRSYADVRPGTFDGEADWAANDVVGRAGGLAGMPVRVDCGTGDPFVHVARALARHLPGTAEVAIAPGCHDDSFWRRRAPRQLRMIAAALSPG